MGEGGGIQFKGIPSPLLGKRFPNHLLGPRSSNPLETPPLLLSLEFLPQGQPVHGQQGVEGVGCRYTLSLPLARTATSRQGTFVAA